MNLSKMGTDISTCPECGHVMGQRKLAQTQPILDSCSSCGGNKAFHLCPVCDKKVIDMRQARLEKAIMKARQNHENMKGKLEAQIRVRDYLAERELQKNGHEKRYLFRSLFYGFGMSMPLIAIGLQMSIQSIMVPIGLFILFTGFIFLAVAVHFRLVYDKTRDAKRWLWLSKEEKLQELTAVTCAQGLIVVNQSSRIGNLTQVN